MITFTLYMNEPVDVLCACMLETCKIISEVYIYVKSIQYVQLLDGNNTVVFS